jgi:hypothetical protein
MTGLAGPDGEPDGQVRLACPRRTQEHDIVLGFDKVEDTEMGDDLAFEAALVVKVELFEGLSGREPSGPDADLPAVGLSGRHFTLEAGGQELFMTPVLGSGPLGQTVNGLGQRRCLERSAQIAEVTGRLGLGHHHATPSALS